MVDRGDAYCQAKGHDKLLSFCVPVARSLPTGWGCGEVGELLLDWYYHKNTSHPWNLVGTFMGS